MEFTKSDSGFMFSVFTDRYGNKCSIHESSVASAPCPCIWLGVKEYPMHLTQQMAADLIPLLSTFVSTGKLPDEPTSIEPNVPHSRAEFTALLTNLYNIELLTLVEEDIIEDRSRASYDFYRDPLSWFLDASDRQQAAVWDLIQAGDEASEPPPTTVVPKVAGAAIVNVEKP